MQGAALFFFPSLSSFLYLQFIQLSISICLLSPLYCSIDCRLPRPRPLSSTNYPLLSTLCTSTLFMLYTVYCILHTALCLLLSSVIILHSLPACLRWQYAFSAPSFFSFLPLLSYLSAPPLGRSSPPLPSSQPQTRAASSCHQTARHCGGVDQTVASYSKCGERRSSHSRSSHLSPDRAVQTRSHSAAVRPSQTRFSARHRSFQWASFPAGEGCEASTACLSSSCSTAERGRRRQKRSSRPPFLPSSLHLPIPLPPLSAWMYQ
mmetsp:Transcript_49289/g.127108  ORF Transcript_49289/g.127108 Transcript_49289/m.127108 type:complete len:263 (+) Transcript_49289:403-1191(+)